MSLRAGWGLPRRPKKLRDLSFMTKGSLPEPEVLEELERQRKIDPEMWE